MGDMIRENLDRGSTVLTFHSDWKPFLRDALLDRFRSIPPEKRHLYGAGRVPHFSYHPEGAPKRVFVRQIFRGGLIRFLGNFHLGRSRAEKEALAIEKALQAGIPVPALLATAAERIFGPFYRLTVVLEEIPNAIPILQKEKTLLRSKRIETIEKIARTVRSMHDHGIYHVDLNVKNLLLDEENNLYVIDLDRAITLDSPRTSNAKEVLARLTRSVEKLKVPLTQSERIRFLRSYLGSSKGVPALARACLRNLWMHRIGWNLFR